MAIISESEWNILVVGGKAIPNRQKRHWRIENSREELGITFNGHHHGTKHVGLIDLNLNKVCNKSHLRYPHKIEFATGGFLKGSPVVCGGIEYKESIKDAK